MPHGDAFKKVALDEMAHTWKVIKNKSVSKLSFFEILRL
jgi:hypothetical protein